MVAREAGLGIIGLFLCRVSFTKTVKHRHSLLHTEPACMHFSTKQSANRRVPIRKKSVLMTDMHRSSPIFAHRVSEA